MSKKKKSPLGKVIGLATAGLTAAAIVQEMMKPAEDRTWHGSILFVPYDFRFPTVERFLQRWWNPDDPRILTPRTFGLGWAVNVGRVVSLLSRPVE
ncbi:MAG TPA: DUF5808 domain-containing protein [Microlunatus sp.]|nr:DUF5808 domain-containing protein [Microlunatus sp.]